MRQIRDVVIPGFSPRRAGDAFPSTAPQDSHNSIRILGRLIPVSGNLASSESWRRMIGGRNRYNHARQQVAKARRNAILIWLKQHRRCFYCEILGEYAPSERIIIRHGDGAMLAKALGVGRATVCRDLSALQATYPAVFGQQNCGVDYDVYMAGWKYAHRTELGNEQPQQNLRYPQKQHGPAARALHAVSRTMRIDIANLSAAASRTHFTGGTDSPESETDADPGTIAGFLNLLRTNCPNDENPGLPVRRLVETRQNVTA